MKRRASALSVLVVGIALVAGCARDVDVDDDETAARSAPATPDVGRGEHLVTTLGCHDCHTPKVMGPQGPQPDSARLLSGHPEDEGLPPPPAPQGPWIVSTTGGLTAWSGPWGISYASNLTPDQETGFANMTLEAFVAAMRTGKHMGVGRPILPPMPWQAYARLSDEDLASIHAYLATIPAVRNRVPDPVVATGGP